MAETKDNFHEYSKSIVKEFIHNVVILDDLIFQEENKIPNVEDIEKMKLSVMNKLTLSQLDSHFVDKEKTFDSNNVANHNIDTQCLIEAFINKGIVCSSISPNIDKRGFVNEDDKIEKANKLFPILSKADIIILDWQTYADDKNGELTCELLKSFKQESENLNRLRLILIYTGANIDDDVIPNVEKIFNNKFQTNKSLQYKSLLLKIIRKKTLESDMESISEENLPEECLETFTQITDGLIPNAIMSAITDIRDNTYKILSVLNKNFDAAFINHKMQLNSPCDADMFLSDLISDFIANSFNSTRICNTVSEQHIRDWFKHKQYEEILNISKDIKDFICNRIDKSKKDNKEELKNEIENLKCLDAIERGFVNVINDICDDGQIKYFVENQRYSFTNHFNKSSINIDKLFSAITMLQAINYNEINKPCMTLGTIIKSLNNSTYYLCIQPRCDSVRIEKGENRKFLLMPLQKDCTVGKICIIDENQQPIILGYRKIHDIELKVFSQSNIVNGHIEATYRDTNKTFIFTDIENTEYVWLADLKFTYAQRIIQEYAKEICRVGLDEYEWFRKLHK